MTARTSASVRAQTLRRLVPCFRSLSTLPRACARSRETSRRLMPPTRDAAADHDLAHLVEDVFLLGEKLDHRAVGEAVAVVEGVDLPRPGRRPERRLDLE